MSTLRLRAGWALLVVFSLALLGVASSAAAQAVEAYPSDESESAARDAFEAGRIAYERGRFSEALARFELAYELNRHPKLLFNVARAAELDGRGDRAIEAYTAYLDAVPDAEKLHFVRARLVKLRAQRERGEGSTPQAVHEEEHVPSARETAALAVRTEAPSPVHADDAPAARPFWKRGVFWGAVAVVVVAGAVTGGLLAARANSGTDSRADVAIQTLEVR